MIRVIVDESLDVSLTAEAGHGERTPQISVGKTSPGWTGRFASALSRDGRVACTASDAGSIESVCGNFSPARKMAGGVCDCLKNCGRIGMI